MILPVLPIVYMRAVFGPVLDSQSLSFLLALAAFGSGTCNKRIWNGFEKGIIIGTVSFINTLEAKIFAQLSSKV